MIGEQARKSKLDLVIIVYVSSGYCSSEDESKYYEVDTTLPMGSWGPHSICFQQLRTGAIYRNKAQAYDV